MKSFANTAMVLIAATAVALTLGATSAMAQPAGPMHGRHGMHGGGPGDMLFGKAFAEAKASLNLTTAQQQAWDAAVQKGKDAHAAARATLQTVHDTLMTELAKPDGPNLAAVAAAADAAQQQNQAARKAVRDQWLALYATFSPDQKLVVRDLLRNKAAHAEEFHQRMLQRSQNSSGG